MVSHYDIEIKEYSGNCDDCGWWEGRDVVVWYKGEPVIEVSGDDHLAGGIPKLEDVLMQILELEGVSVSVSVQDDDDA